MKKFLLVIAMTAALAACHDSVPVQSAAVVAPPAVVQAPPATVVIQQQPVANSGDGVLTGALVGGAVGYMAGTASRQQPAYYHPRPVYRPVYQKNVTVVQQHIHVPATPAVSTRLSLTKRR